MKNIFLVLGSLLAALAIVTGAFAAHGLKAYLLEHGRTDTFETAVRYHMYQALGLLMVGMLQIQFPEKNLNAAGYLLLTGTVIFSSSLYLLSLANLRWMGAVAPVGGVMMIAGWLLVAWSCWKS